MTDNAVVTDDFAVKPIGISWPTRSQARFQPSGTVRNIRLRRLPRGRIRVLSLQNLAGKRPMPFACC
jgi:hypothetical protein